MTTLRTGPVYSRYKLASGLGLPYHRKALDSLVFILFIHQSTCVCADVPVRKLLTHSSGFGLKKRIKALPTGLIWLGTWTSDV